MSEYTIEIPQGFEEPTFEEHTAEADARKSPICLGCFGEKQYGCVVCWKCWRQAPNGETGYKYFAGTLTEWLLIANP
jgi:hypothetical protein